ncbi:MAG: A/G-specific adenine glycosylase [Planctomycetota bacterium]
MTSQRRASLRRRLYAWYDEHARDLPWRETRDPYRIWVSEVMLQQTRVETVRGYYERFLEKFPTLETLADAHQDDVLAAWSGLGYYRRARALHVAARVCRDEHGGRVPRDAEAFRALPGVGAYTTGAVMSIAFDRPLPAVDGNVVRVLSRLLGEQGEVGQSKVARRLQEAATALVPARVTSRARGPAIWNQAVMELGARVCLPRNPRCEECPWTRSCVARRDGLVSTIPRTKASRRSPVVPVAVAACIRAGRLLVIKRPPTGLLASLPALPSFENGGPEAIEEALGVRPRPGDPIHRWKHTFSHRVWDASLYLTRVRGLRVPPSARWLDQAALESHPFPTAFRPVREALADLLA